VNRRRLLLPLALVAAAIALLYSLDRQENQNLQTPESTATDVRYSVQDAELTRYGVDGSLTLQGHASEVRYFRDGSANATDLRLHVFGAHGGPWLATAPLATLPGKQQEIELHGPVQVTGRWPDNHAPLRIDTAHLWLAPETHRFHTDARVDVSGGGRQASGTGMTGNWADSDLTLLADVRMRIEVPKHHAH
jgi:Uncharacterized protein conserved in bacteria